MKYYVKERGLEGQYYIYSAGISGYHSGDPADRRMQSHAIRRGYDLTSLSRKFYPDADFSDFDMIIGMDDQNIRDLQRMATSEEEKNKIFKLTDFCQRFSYRDSVPDPYYGGDSGFELVLDLLEDAVEGQTVPEMTPEVVANITNRYIELYEHITGTKFEKADSTNILARIENNVNECLTSLK